jgi:hypothetical protein
MLTDTLRVHAMFLCASGDLNGAEVVLNELLDVTRSTQYPFAGAKALADTAGGRIESSSVPSEQPLHILSSCDHQRLDVYSPEASQSDPS